MDNRRYHCTFPPISVARRWSVALSFRLSTSVTRQQMLKFLKFNLLIFVSYFLRSDLRHNLHVEETHHTNVIFHKRIRKLTWDQMRKYSLG